MSTEENKVEETAAADAPKKTTTKKTTKAKKIKVEFLKSPTGHFNLGYSVGQQGDFESKQAEVLIDSGYAKKV